MCKDRDDKIKKKAKESRKMIEKSIENNEEKLCKMIGLLLSGKCPNLTPVDGDETK